MTLEEMLLQFILSGLTSGAIYALIGLGFAVVHNAAGIVNFSQVDFVTLGGMFLYSCLVSAGLPMWAGFILAAAAGALCGALTEVVFLRPARSRDTLILIFITIGASIFIRGVIQHVWGRSSMALPPISSGAPLDFLGAAVTLQSLWILGAAGAAVAALRWFFSRTRPGKAMRAAANDPVAAALVGVDVRRSITASFALAGALGALAGMLITPIITLAYDVGVMIGLKGFAGAVLGGYGSFVGAVVGGLILGVLESLGAGLISSTYKDVIAFVILLLILFLKPSGLVGRSDKERF